MRVKAKWQQGYQVELKARDHTFIVDEPISVGGQDHGPMPTELLLASLASCLTLAIRHVSLIMRLELLQLQVDVQGEFDRTSFKCVRLIAEVTSSLDPQLLKQVMDKAIKYCYVSNTLYDGCQISYGINSN
ncbi:MAG: OsmC family protein [Desulfosporosinus sp.]|nr:OsmC family protein [Desulfosporosinus sp.]